MIIEISRTSNACFHVNPQVFLNPMYISHHFQGSVNHRKKGSHDMKRVTPDEKAYRLKIIEKEIRFPRIMTIVIYPKHDEINIIPEALIKKMIAMIHTGLE